MSIEQEEIDSTPDPEEPSAAAAHAEPVEVAAETEPSPAAEVATPETEPRRRSPKLPRTPNRRRRRARTDRCCRRARARPAVEPAPAEPAPEPAAEPDAANPPPNRAAEPEPARSVGRYIADALRAVGVRYAFTVPGESFLGLLEGLDAAGIRIVSTRHEGAAAFMAEAHGQLTGRPAVCLATRAVGAANLAIGIHTARQDSSPMFALVGQVERRFRGREAFQEIEQATTLGGLTPHAVEIRTAADVPAAIGDAIRAALVGRPGPVLLSLPEDLLDEEIPAGTPLDTARPAPPRPEPDEVRSVLQFLASR